MKEKVCIYARVSTTHQNHDSQLHELRDYCLRRNWDEPEIITDVISGVKTSRQGFDRLMTMVRGGKVDVLVCYKLDRLGRSLAHLAQVIGELTTNRVALIIPSQGIDTSSQNPAAALQLNILCAVAQFEREIIKERVNAGLLAAKTRGIKLGRPTTLDKHRNAVSGLLSQGKGVCAIARELSLPLSSAHKLVKLASLHKTVVL